MTRPGSRPKPRRDPVLVALLEEQLETETQPQVGPAGIDEVAHRLGEPGFLEAGGGGGEGADAGQHDAVRAAQHGRIARHLGRETGAGERLGDAAQVPRAVVDDGDLGGAGHGKA